MEINLIKMRLFIIVLVLVSASAEISLPMGYHAAIGIPEASIIKETESRLLSSRIASGSNSYLGEHPFFGGLIIGLKNNLVSVCGSTLISNTRLVTAAHCWNDGFMQATQFEVVLGSLTLFSGGVRTTTNNVTTHPLYNASNLQNDIAVIVIPWTYLSYYIQLINLPHGVLQNSTFVGNSSVVVGFGKNGESESITVGQRLKDSYVNIITNTECAKTFGDLISDSKICSAGYVNNGPCAGDAGGPLYVKTGNYESILIGVMSFASPYGCNVGLPYVSTRVTSYVSWIESV